MKLVAAKCPNCGAGLNVNPKQEATKCEYCNQAILIDDAIAKYKLEISGSVEVKNLPKQDNILKIANRNYKNKDYEKAYEEYDKLLKLDPDNTLALLRYGLCKTLLNNYIDFTLDYLSKTFDEVVDILKEKNEYEDNIIKYIDDTLLVVNESLASTVSFYGNRIINRFDLSQIQDKATSCLLMFEKLYAHSNDEYKELIAKAIISNIDFIEMDKVCKTGDGDYGNINKKFTLDKKLRSLLEQKRIQYGGTPIDTATNIANKISTQFDVNNIVHDNRFKIAMLCTSGFLFPPLGIILVWTWAKDYEMKTKIIYTVAMVLWFFFVLLV